MGRSLLFGGVMGAVLLLAATSRSDVSTRSQGVEDRPSVLPEPTLGRGVKTAPGDEAHARDPFAPYDVGPAESVWPYESLSPTEQAVIDRDFDTDRWQSIHNAYASGVNERSRKGLAEAAQHLLGIDSLDAIGVVR